MSRSASQAAAVGLRVGFGWQQLRHLVLSASQFQHILKDPGWTSQAYMGHAGYELSLLSPKRRGTILEQFCRKVLAEANPNSKIEDPAPGIRSDGSRRPPYQSEYDFSMDGKRVECKSRQLTWNRRRNCWHVGFPSMKPPWSRFDELYPVIFTPDSLHIMKHDVRTGVSFCGTRGFPGQDCWQTALSEIHNKVLTVGHCELVAEVDLSAVESRSWLAQQMEGMAAPQDDAYMSVPLNQMAAPLRGLRIEQIAFEVDLIIHPHCSFSRASSKVDWVRGNVKVEVKHGQMLFDGSKHRWYCAFSGIKCARYGIRDQDVFDELWLAIWSPFGIHFLKHPGDFDPAVTQDESRRRIVVAEARHMLDVKEAHDQMLKKMEVDWGCEHLASVQWDTTASG